VGRIAIVHAQDVSPVRVRDAYPESQTQSFTEGELDAETSTYFPRDGESLELFAVTFPPDAEIRPHAHTASEIVYVTKGELRLGSQVCPAGSALFIEGMTLYSFRAGPEGVTFVNFRAELGSASFSKEQFMAKRGSAT